MMVVLVGFIPYFACRRYERALGEVKRQMALAMDEVSRNDDAGLCLKQR